MKLIKDQRNAIWTQIFDKLTWKQVQSMPMGATWLAKASFARKATKAKAIHALCDQLSAHDEQVRRSITYFQGMRLPRTSQLVRELVHAHVVAVQEYDHDSADEIETYLFEISRMAEGLGA
jgi:hypothetical protein